MEHQERHRRRRKKLFTSGVPLTVMPLDSTANLKLHEAARTALFAHGGMLTNILAGLYYQWSAATRSPTPILYDPMTLASHAGALALPADRRCT